MQCQIVLPGGQIIQPPPGFPCGGLTTFRLVYGNFLNILITFTIISVLFSIIWSGIQMTISQGEKQKVEAARKRLTWSIVGLVLVFLSFFILNVISYLFQVPMLLNF